jgi:hypothetical protein
MMGRDRNVKKQQTATNHKLPAPLPKGFNHSNSKIDQVNENTARPDLLQTNQIDYLALEL